MTLSYFSVEYDAIFDIGVIKYENEGYLDREGMKLIFITDEEYDNNRQIKTLTLKLC